MFNKHGYRVPKGEHSFGVKLFVAVLVFTLLKAVRVATTILMVMFVFWFCGMDITPEIMVVSGVVGFLLPIGGGKE